MPSVTFIIPSWNRRKSLSRLLSSIFSQSNDDYEIIVVDNASTDGTHEYLMSLGDKVRVIYNYRNLGASQAKNQGVVASRANFLWFLDSDSELLDCETMNRGLELIDADNSIGVIGGEMNSDRSGKIVYRINDQYPSLKRKVILSSKDTLCLDCDYIPTCNCLVRKKLIMDWGGFDPSYFITGEDAEMCFAVRKSGYRCVFHSRVTVLHHIDMDSRKGSLYIKYRNLMRFVLVNMPWWQVLKLPVYFVKMVLIPLNADLVLNSKDNPYVSKYLSPHTRNIADKGNLGGLAALAVVALHFAVSVSAAFINTMMKLPHLLSIRRRRPDFLLRVDV